MCRLVFSALLSVLFFETAVFAHVEAPNTVFNQENFDTLSLITDVFIVSGNASEIVDFAGRRCLKTKVNRQTDVIP